MPSGPRNLTSAAEAACEAVPRLAQRQKLRRIKAQKSKPRKIKTIKARALRSADGQEFPSPRGLSSHSHRDRASGEDFAQQTVPLATCVASGREREGGGSAHPRTKTVVRCTCGEIVTKNEQREGRIPSLAEARSSRSSRFSHRYCMHLRVLPKPLNSRPSRAIVVRAGVAPA